METIAVIFAAVFGVFALGLFGAAILGWPLMIAFGILHSHFVAVPAFGFWASTLFALVTTMVLGSVGKAQTAN
jgi:hypothetical protein